MQRFKRFLVGHLWAKCWLVLAGPSLILIGSVTMKAQTPTKIWTDNIGDHNWFSSDYPDVASNWETLAGLSAPIPTNSDIVAVNNGTTAQIGEAGALAGSLYIGQTLTGSPAVVGSTVQLLPGGDLTVSNPVVIGTEGTLDFSGGHVTTPGIVDNGNVLFDTAINNFVSVPISGTGKFTITGSGTVQVSGVSTYSGATTISAGVLQAGSVTGFSPNSAFTVNSTLDLNGFSNTIGSLFGTGIVLNNGATAAALTAGNDNANSTFSGILQNGTSVLALAKSGKGMLVLTGANTYSGGTTISAGTLQLGNGGTAGSITGNVSDNGVLAFDRSDSVSFAGSISGSGSVTQIGAGTTILTGNNTYSGGTTISAGTLQLGNGGTTGSITGNVANNGVLAFDHSDALSFAGDISGTGSVTQIG